MASKRKATKIRAKAKAAKAISKTIVVDLNDSSKGCCIIYDPLGSSHYYPGLTRGECDQLVHDFPGSSNDHKPGEHCPEN